MGFDLPPNFTSSVLHGHAEIYLANKLLKNPWQFWFLNKPSVLQSDDILSLPNIHKTKKTRLKQPCLNKF
jgi:hypothetical protein